ncbi:hypothetical protein HYX12_02835 [Candidatus Woesearchaeota archaeon]|nr:hypothetical protein [Candidatus Woesearchaeota archaeon]
MSKSLSHQKLGSSILWGTIFSGVIALLAIIFYGGPAIAAIRGQLTDVGERTGLAFGDCDKDQIGNEFDRCPCRTTGEEGDTRNSFIGCPKGISAAEAAKDRETCYQFVLGKDVYGSKCPEGKNCPTRCEEVQGTAAEVSAGKKPGVKTQGDLVVNPLKITPSDLITVADEKVTIKPAERATISVGGVSLANLPLIVKISNQGTENIADTFWVRFYICTDRQEHCVEKIGKSVSALSARKEETVEIVLPVGTNGDYCEGEPDVSKGGNARECYLKVVVDAEELLDEPDEANNVQFLLLRLEGQEETKNFKKFQIGVFNGDSTGGRTASITGGEQGGIIEWYCEETSTDDYASCSKKFFTYAGEDLNYNGLTAELFPQSKPEAGNCLILAIEQDQLNSDNGAGIFNQGDIIYSGVTENKPLTPTDFSLGTPENVQEALRQTWYARPSGALICKQGSWHQCDEENNEQLLTINQIRYHCQNLHWVKDQP